MRDGHRLLVGNLYDYTAPSSPGGRQCLLAVSLGDSNKHFPASLWLGDHMTRVLENVT